MKYKSVLVSHEASLWITFTACCKSAQITPHCILSFYSADMWFTAFSNFSPIFTGFGLNYVPLMRKYISFLFIFLSLNRAADHLPSRNPPQPLLQRAGWQRLPQLQKSGRQRYGAHLVELHSKLSEPCGNNRKQAVDKDCHHLFNGSSVRKSF